MFLVSVEASDKLSVSFSSCVDGDTAKFILNKKEVTVRFLAIDTPETKHPTKGEEPYGKEASNYTCETLKKASLIELEYDSNSDKTDKYDRHLVWVWVDNYLFQDEIIKKGLAEVAYLYDDYKYTSILEEHQTLAKLNKVGIWSDEEPDEETNYIYLILALIVLIILCMVSPDIRKNVFKKGKKEVKKSLKKYGL